MDKEMFEGSDFKYIPMTSLESRMGHEVAEDVYYYTNQIVNIIFIGNPGNGKWYLIDAGMPRSAPETINQVAERFGEGREPEAIILTHGHFDHVGGLVELLEKWDVPVYAHEKEVPYLTGELSYPEPDPTVEGGMLAKISTIYPNEPINIRPHLQLLPKDGTLLGLEEWKWVHTPGHTPGHVSLFRERDSLLISGDAFVTVRQDSFYKVLTQQPEVCGPPRYLTTDWRAAKTSVEILQELNPKTVIPGHGISLKGEELTKGLRELVANFEQVAVPDYGKYI
ncbi:MBL fold metallo-hydrolase [Ornithinibacillus sp. 179-J 7C1 HS]|uniref:MBL fold metallo-hydrolase n=1 Tax=Ornithinibacillus sp. 179-J 7C1 HS TaxID=3142384 RepID=UPI0039A3789A